MTVQTPVAKFENKELSLNVNIYEVNGEPMFDALEVAKTLGYERPQQTLIDIHKKFEKQGYANHVHFGKVNIDGSRGREKSIKVCSETVIYELTFSSRLDSAQKFRYWVASEVLPNIRRHGGYISEQASPEQLTSLQEQVELWKTRALEKRELAFQLEEKNKELEQKGQLWETRAHQQKEQKKQLEEDKQLIEKQAQSNVKIAKSELKRTMRDILTAVNSSNFSDIDQAKHRMRMVLERAPRKMTVSEFQEACTDMLEEIADMFSIVEKHRRLGWTKYINFKKKQSQVRGVVISDIMLAIHEGSLRETVDRYNKEINEHFEKELEFDLDSI